MHSFFNLVLRRTFYLYENLLQVSQSIIVPELMQTFGLNAHGLSLYLGSTFLISYSASQFPVGFILDRYSTRIILPFATLICASSCYFYAEAQSFNLPYFVVY